MADYARIALLQSIADNLEAEVDEEDTDYAELRILRAIVTAEGGTPTPVAGTFERISLLNDWATAVEAETAATDDYPDVEALRVIGDAYSATVDEESTDYEQIRILTAIATATEPEE